MNYILFVLSAAYITSSYFYFDYKLSIARKQQMIASNQYKILREKYKNFTKNNINTNSRSKLNIKFSTPASKAGITKPNISLYIAPLYDAQAIKYINIRMETIILDSAEVNGETWFYVALPIDSNINSRGWINKNNFSTIYSNSKNINRSY